MRITLALIVGYIVGLIAGVLICAIAAAAGKPPPPPPPPDPGWPRQDESWYHTDTPYPFNRR